jgi:hypothetical protein
VELQQQQQQLCVGPGQALNGWGDPPPVGNIRQLQQQQQQELMQNMAIDCITAKPDTSSEQPQHISQQRQPHTLLVRQQADVQASFTSYEPYARQGQQQQQHLQQQQQLLNHRTHQQPAAWDDLEDMMCLQDLHAALMTDNV